MLLGYLALTAASLFTGAAFYINIAEHPARLVLDDRSLLAEWKPAYNRGYIMQASLAIIGFVLGAVAWWLTGRLGFLAGAISGRDQLAVDFSGDPADQQDTDEHGID